MSPGSRGRGVGGRKVGSALSLQPPGPRRPCGRCAWAWRGGSGRGTELAGGPEVGGRRLGRATFVCLLSTTGVRLNPPSLAVPDETRFFLRRKVTGTGDSPPPNPAFAGHGWASPPPVPESGEPSPAFSPSPAMTLEGFRRSLFRLAQPAPDCSGIVLFTSLFGEPLPGIQDRAQFIFVSPATT